MKIKKHISGILTALLAVNTSYAQNDPNLYDTWRMSTRNTTYSFWDRSGDDVDMGDMSFEIKRDDSYASCKITVNVPFDWRTSGNTVSLYYNTNSQSFNVEAKPWPYVVQSGVDTSKKHCERYTQGNFNALEANFKVNPVYNYSISGNTLSMGGMTLVSTSGKQRVIWPPQKETKTTTIGSELSNMNASLSGTTTGTTVAEKSVTTEETKPAPTENKVDVHSYTWNDGTHYEGEWLGNKKHGQGTVTFTDGTKYVGQWKDDQMHGKGTFSWPSGSSYTGDFRNDKMEGSGTLIIPGGDKYTGEWANNKKNGQGTFKWADGSSYSGQWKDNKMHGKGTYISASGTKQTGEFVDDVFVK